MAQENIDTNDTSTKTQASSGFVQSLLYFVIANALLFAVLGTYLHFNREVLANFLPAAAPANNLQAEIVTLQSRLTQAEQKISEQQELLKNNSTPASPIDMEKLTALEASIAQLQQAAKPEELQNLKDQLQQVTVLQQGLSQQVQQQAEKTPPDLRLVAFFQTLRSKALDSNQPFEDSYQRFYAIAHNYPAIADIAEPLEVFSATGRPTLLDLQRAYKEALATYLREKDGTDNSLGGKVKRNLSEFVTVRKLDDAGDSPLAAMNRAEQFLQSGNVEQAAAELHDLPEDTTDYFSGWLEEAKGYYRIPQLIQKIDQRIADAVMQANTGAPHAP